MTINTVMDILVKHIDDEELLEEIHERLLLEEEDDAVNSREEYAEFDVG